MSAKALVDRILPYAPGWARSTGVRSILKEIERGQDQLFNWDAENMIWVGSENKGWPPYLTTTSETYEYEISATNLTNVTAIQKTIGGTAYNVRCKRVMRVFIDVTGGDYDYDKRYLGYAYPYFPENIYSTQTTRIRIAEIPATSMPSLENTGARVRFLEDPGTTTEKYFVEFMWEPMRLSSESIPLCVPSMYESALEDYVIGRIEQVSTGRGNERLARFYSGTPDFPISWIKQFRSEMSAGAQKEFNETQPRTC